MCVCVCVGQPRLKIFIHTSVTTAKYQLQNACGDDGLGIMANIVSGGYTRHLTDPFTHNKLTDPNRRKTFLQVNPHKAAGSGGIPSRVLRACAD